MVSQPFRQKRFSSPQSLAETLAERIAGELRQAVKARKSASLVVSGGRTPLVLFEQIQQQKVPWSQVTITLADERWVAVTAPDSNEGLLRRALLRGPVKEAKFVGMKTPEPTPEAGWQACEAALKTVPRPFDVVVLGMGNDGHIASLFSDSPRLAEALDPDGEALCLPMHSKSALQPRMSLTLAALLHSRRIAIHIVGDDKRRVFRQVCVPGPAHEYPVRALLQQEQVPVEVFWAP